ncbi:TolB family protein [Actinoalloteichus fjordicus]|uniref:WD40-like beta propeller repeat protein n=1 Tax=Actinoalloteichus fjordicus TaxID=1612552 RepID=A0AAC9LFF1_9PSEU|nr:PD40 domain-containing protein [Actinoalloteichus fjordicus]APU15879.1 WD40-like beta propeller repeat protein [Actinoalloteichus fjordicus]
MRRALPAVVTATAATILTLALPATASAATNGPIHFGYSSVINPDGTGEGSIPSRGLYSDFLSFSPDGMNTLYRSQESTEPNAPTTLVIDNAQYTAPRTLVDSAELGVSYVSTSAWSPDGEWIAFRSFATDGSRDIGLIKPDGTDLTMLTVPSHLDIFSVSWLPDSSGVVYTRSPGVGDYELCTTTVATDGTDCVDLPGGQEYFFDHARVSPDGTTVLLTSQTSVDPETGSVYDLVRVDIDGTNLVNLTENEAGNQTTSSAWSPDGTAIAFSRYDGLWTMDADGGNATRLSTANGDNVAWQPVS